MINFTLSNALLNVVKGLVITFPIFISQHENSSVEKSLAQSDYNLEMKIQDLHPQITIHVENKPVHFNQEEIVQQEFDLPPLYAPNWNFKFPANDNVHKIGYHTPAGDVNGDGFDDFIIVGDHKHFGGNDYSNTVAYLYYGSPNGIKAEPDTVFEIHPPDYFSIDHLNAIGDINGDGFDDLSANPGMSSSVEIYYGSAEGLNTTPAQIINFEQYAEYSILIRGNPVGDVNGDGFQDALFSARGSMTSFLVYGSAQGLNPTPAWISPQDYSEGGTYTGGTPGDVNNDGFSDIYINSSIGDAYLFLGSANGPGDIPAWQDMGEEGPHGYTDRQLITGDFNGDGLGDIMYSRRDEAAINYIFSGYPYYSRVYILFGSPFSIFAPDLFSEVLITDFNQELAVEINSIGDFNNDGFSDISMGSDIFYGYQYGIMPDPNSNYKSVRKWFPAGDLNGDGMDDIFENGNFLSNLATYINVFYSPHQGEVNIECADSVIFCNQGPDFYYKIPELVTSQPVKTTNWFTVNSYPSRTGNTSDASGPFLGNTEIRWNVQTLDNRILKCTTRVILKTLPITGVSIKDAYSVSPGGDLNTIYAGHGDDGFRLAALPSGGGSPYSYLWSNGSTEKNPRITERIPGEYPYWVNLTNANGCTSSDTVIIKVENALCSSPLVDAVMSQYPMILQNEMLANLIKANSKVAVCKDGQTLCLDRSVVGIRLQRAGYSLGACTPGIIPAEAFMTQEIEDIISGKLKVIVGPNPSTHSFQLNIISIYNASVKVRITDISGRQVELINAATTNSTITVGSKLSAGTYIAEVISGEERKVVKLVKM